MYDEFYFKMGQDVPHMSAMETVITCVMKSKSAPVYIFKLINSLAPTRFE